MALPVVEVRALADVQGLEGTDAPHCVIVRGAEAVRDALPMLAALTKKSLVFKGVGLVNAAEEEDGGDSDYGSDDSDRSDTSDDSAEEEGPAGSGWVLVNMQPLRHVAVLAALLEEVLNDIVPLLTENPGDRDILRRLLANAKEIHRVGLVVAGQPGELSLKLGNKVQKMVSHAFHDKHDEPRTEAQRAAWVAERLNSLRDQAERLYENYPVALE